MNKYFPDDVGVRIVQTDWGSRVEFFTNLAKEDKASRKERQRALVEKLENLKGALENE